MATIKNINGIESITMSYNKDKEIWTISVNGETAMECVGSDELPHSVGYILTDPFFKDMLND